MRWLLIFVFVAIIFGHSSISSAGEFLDRANLLLKEIDQLSEIINQTSDPKKLLELIGNFVKKIQGAGLSTEETRQAVETLKKIAWKVDEKNWWIIMERPYQNQKGVYVGAYLSKGPPENLKEYDVK